MKEERPSSSRISSNEGMRELGGFGVSSGLSGVCAHSASIRSPAIGNSCDFDEIERIETIERGRINSKS